MRIYHKFRIGETWFPSATGSDQIGSEAFNSGISAVSWGRNRIDVFVRNGETIKHATWSGIWDAWHSLEGNAIAQPVATTWGTGRLDVFAEFADGQVWHRWFDGDWQPWQSIGGKIIGLPCPVSWGPHRLDLSVRGTDDGVWHKSWNGSSWQPSKLGFGDLGNRISGNPVEVSWGTGRLDLFSQSRENPHYILHKAHWGGWQPGGKDWLNIGGQSVTGTLDAVAPSSDRLDMVFLGPDNAIWHKSWNGANWVPAGGDWISLGGSIAGPPRLSPAGSAQLEIFARGINGFLMHWR
jgi:hypothetical protein